MLLTTTAHPPTPNYLIEYLIIGAYLAFLIYLGLRVKNLSANTSDYFRSGTKATWWLVGMSTFISSVSAFTFTGNAGAMFEGGWSILAIYWGQGMGLLILAIFLAAWFRQTRSITYLDILKQRFDVNTEQIIGYVKILTFAFHGALTLYGLALFSGTTFSLPLVPTILVLGAVAIIYSVAGGQWAVLATDFVQALLMFPMTVALCIFCLYRIGGVGEFLRKTSEIPELHLFDTQGEFPVSWMVATAVIAIIGQTNIVASVKFFSVKDGKSARKAAAMACIFITFGCVVWFVPPMTARVLFAEEILAAGTSNPSETAYAFMALKYLPNGMIALMIVAMFSATMSSLDTALNRNAAMLVNNIVPLLREKLKMPVLSDARALLYSRFGTALMGLIVLSLALVYATQEDFGMTKFYYLFSSIVAMPVMLPFVLGLYIKRTPPWSAFAAMIAGGIPTVISWVSATYFDQSWSYEFRAALILGASGLTFLATMPFYKGSSQKFKERNEAFFKTMHTPVDFEKEVGEGNDAFQLKMLGGSSLALAVFLLVLQALPNDLTGRITLLSVNAFVAAVGALLYYKGLRHAKAGKIGIE